MPLSHIFINGHVVSCLVSSAGFLNLSLNSLVSLPHFFLSLGHLLIKQFPKTALILQTQLSNGVNQCLKGNP